MGESRPVGFQGRTGEDPRGRASSLIASRLVNGERQPRRIPANERREDLKLPGVENAVVDPKKIRDYLLSTSHALGRFKASFFLALGYTTSNWDLLVRDFGSLAKQQEAEPSGRNEYGQKYTVRGILKGPSGRTAEVVTVWIVLSGEVVPRFVTAFPGGDK